MRDTGVVYDAGSGLIKKQGFKGALREGGTSAKVATIKNPKIVRMCFLQKFKDWSCALDFML